MKLSKEQRQKLEETIKGVNCSFSFKCLEKDLEDMPKIEQLGMTDIFECKATEARSCGHAMPFGYSHFCKCPTRLYLKKEVDI